MSIIPKGAGSGGKPYTGDNPIIPSITDKVIEKNTLLTSPLTIKAIEDIAPEIAEQTPLITEIMESLAGRVTLANITPETVLKGYRGYKGQQLVEGTYKPHGQYIWNRYEIAENNGSVTNPVLKLNGSGAKIEVTSTNVDLDHVDERFFGGFVLQADTFYFEYVENDGLYYIEQANRFKTTYDPKTNTMYNSNTASFTNAQFTYTGTKTYKYDTHEFLEYAVSDNQNEYPGNGEQDGHWYKRFGIDFGELMVSDEMADITIEYGLGVPPKHIFITAESGYSAETLYVNTLAVNTDKLIVQRGTSSGVVYNASAITIRTGTYFTVKAQTSQFKFKRGIKYIWYAIA